MISVDQVEELDELRALFKELWDSAETLTDEKRRVFAETHSRIKRLGPDLDMLKIEDAVGRSEPPNITVGSEKKPTKGMFLEQLRRQIYEYRGSFREVTGVLEESHLHHAELTTVGPANETNRFLSWARRTQAPGEDWQSAKIRSQEDRRAEIRRLGREWMEPDRDKIPENYIEWLGRVKSVFGSSDSIDNASQEQLTQGSWPSTPSASRSDL